jgi:hypothetical protein
MRFYLDGIDGEFTGRNLGRWNGWACPQFTESEALRFMNTVNNQRSGLSITFDEVNKVFTVNDENSGEAESFAEIGGTGCYAIGAWAWCWNIVDDGGNENE